MDRTILTSKDMQMILAGLRSLGQRELILRSVDGENPDRIIRVYHERDSMLIDLSSWYKGSLCPN